jgi:hypothetical protein
MCVHRSVPLLDELVHQLTSFRNKQQLTTVRIGDKAWFTLWELGIGRSLAGGTWPTTLA